MARGSAENPAAVFPLTEPGTPQPCWWDNNAIHIGTNVFTFASLGVKPIDGTAFSLKIPIFEGWSYKQGMREITLDVVLDEQAASIRVPDFGILGNQKIDIPIKVTPKRNGRVRVFSAAVGARSPRFSRDKIMKAQPGVQLEAQITGTATDSGNHIFDIYDADERVMFMAFYPFHDPDVKFAYRTVMSDPEKMTLILRVDQWIEKGDKYDLTISMDDLETDEPTGFSSTKRLEAKMGMVDIPFDVTALRPGMFKLRYKVVDKTTGKIIHSDFAYYAKPDGKCVWDDVQYGIEDTVPPPWTKPIFGEKGFKVWNRSIDFSGKGLVSSIVSAGDELLASPIEILFNGKSIDFDVTDVEKHVSYAKYSLKGKNAPVEVRARVEFDGYMWFETKFVPPCSSLSLKIPVRREMVVGFDDCSDPMKKLALPKGKNYSISYSPANKPWWWIGSAVGLMGGIDNLRDWHCRDMDNAVKLNVDDKEAAITYVLVDTALDAGKPRKIGFYLQPTPVKRKNMELALLPRSELVSWTGTMARFFDVKMPGHINMKKLARFQELQRKGKRVFYYNGTRVNSPIQPWWGWLGQEWNSSGDPAYFAEEVPFKDRADRDNGVWVTGCLNVKSFFDHKLWSICWFLNHPDYGVKDMYFDLAAPSRSCNNKIHGCIWKDDFGRVRHDTSLRTCREIHKRIYREMKKKNSDCATIGHLQYQRTPADVFFDRLTMGETYDRFVRGTMNYYDVLNPEMMQIQYSSRSAEVVVNMIPQIIRIYSMYAPEKLSSYNPHTPENDRVNRHATAYFKIHDLEISPQSHGADQWSKPDTFLRKFGTERIHRGYYHADCPISVVEGNARFIYAYFEGNGQRLVILLNDTDDEVTKTISIKGVSAVGHDIFNSSKYDFKSGTSCVTLGPRESAFILFTEGK